MNVRQKLQEKTGHDEGFTLVELLVVIVILGVLSAVVVFSVGGITDNSKASACEANVKAVQVASEAFRAQSAEATYATDLGALQKAGLLKDLPGKVSDDNLSFTTDGYTVNYAAGDGNVTADCPN